jgi:hypothetical protein
MVESTSPAPAVVESAPTLAELPVPRRVAIATLFREAGRTSRELAARYAAFAQGPSLASMRTAVDQLAALKRAQVAALAALAPVLDPEGESPAVVPPGASPGDRADLFARASDGERVLAAALREIAALLGDPARCPGLQPLAAEAARPRSLLRDLYLRYS